MLTVAEAMINVLAAGMQVAVSAFNTVVMAAQAPVGPATGALDQTVSGIGDMSVSLAVAAIGSALGTGVAGMAAVGAWKRAFAANKAAPFILVAFVGAPLSQTIYGMILRNAIGSAEMASVPVLLQMFIGLFAGVAMGMSAFMQGKAGAKAADAFAETGKGFGQYIMVVGVIETVALFVMVFTMTALP